jgi:hypothetical protein
MLASNLASLLKHTMDRTTGQLRDAASDEIIAAALVTHAGQVRDPRVAAIIQTQAGESS